MKALKTIIVLLIGIVLGVVLTVGGVVLGGYLALKKDGMMGTVEDKVLDTVIPADSDFAVNFSEDIRALSLLTYGQNVYGALKDGGNTTVGDLEAALGYDALSVVLSTNLGIDKAVIESSAIAELGDTIVNELKVKNLSEDMGVEFPSMPIFSDEAFLNTPVIDAFSTLGNDTLDSFMTVVYNDDPDTTKTRSNIILQKMGKLKVSEISTEFEGVINNTTLGEILKINDDAEPILIALRNTKLSSSELNSTIKNLTIKDVFKNYNVGVISLIPADTKVTQMASELSKTLASTSIYKLEKLGIFTMKTAPTNLNTKSAIYNSTVNEMMDKYVKILNNPLDAATLVTNPRVDYYGATITQEALDELEIAKGTTLVLHQATVIADGTEFTTPFNVDASETGASLVIEQNVKITCESGGYMFIAGNAGGNSYSIKSTIIINKTATETYDSVLVENVME